MQTIPITKEGHERLKKELHNLKTVERPQTIEAIEVARSHGDLSENAEYDAAKDRQAFIEGRIMDLEYKVANADVIDPTSLPTDRIVFASRFVLENVDTGEEVTYQLVGQEESDISLGRVSVSSPLGQAILGKAPGSEITVQAPSGQKLYELIEIL